jgi:hypothetical protein
MAEYFNKMKSLADEMAATGKPIEDEEIISHIFIGLDSEYNPVLYHPCAWWRAPTSPLVVAAAVAVATTTVVVVVVAAAAVVATNRCRDNYNRSGFKTTMEATEAKAR